MLRKEPADRTLDDDSFSRDPIVGPGSSVSEAVTNERVAKIRKILETGALSESHVQHLFVLARKLIETAPATQPPKFELLKFFCDWTVHPWLDRSEQAALMIERANRILADHLSKGLDSERFVKELKRALSLTEARNELGKLIGLYDSGGASLIDAGRWNRIAIGLAEIVSECPLTIGATRDGKLRTIRERIQMFLPMNSIREISVFGGSPSGLDSLGYSFSIRLIQTPGPPLTGASIEIPFLRANDAS